MKSDNDIDILGNFYGEFVKYGGNDGNPLGIVLTLRHITNLMAELIDIQPYDTVLEMIIPLTIQFSRVKRPNIRASIESRSTYIMSFV